LREVKKRARPSPPLERGRGIGGEMPQVSRYHAKCILFTPF